MILPKTIDEVLLQLDRIIAQSRIDQSRLGYFAILYREVTLAVKKGIADGFFADGPRMERLDVVFANRYLKAYQQYQTGEKPTRSWILAFDAAEQKDLLILQHLFLGMNAHINLDLGIAAATIAPEEKIQALQNDFYKINDILFSLIGTMQDRLAKVSLFFGWIDQLAGRKDEQFATFSLKKARDHAWNLANLLAPIAPENWEKLIATADQGTLVFGKLISQPKLRSTRWMIRALLRFESEDVVANMDRLADRQKEFNA